MLSKALKKSTNSTKYFGKYIVWRKKQISDFGYPVVFVLGLNAASIKHKSIILKNV